MDIIKDIINNLNQSTLSNEIEWDIFNSLFNSDTVRKYETRSVDGKTKFVLEIRLNSNLSLDTESCHMIIYNDDLLNGYKFFYPRNYTELRNLFSSVYGKYIKTTLPQKNENDTYKNIFSNMFSKQQNRDHKIDTILGDKNTEEKSKSIFNRLFKK